MEIIIDYSPVPKLTFSDLSCARKLALVHNQLCALSWLSHERHCGENFHPYYFCVGWSFSCITFGRSAWWFDADILMLMLMLILMLMFLLPGSTNCLYVDVVVDVYHDQVWQNCLMLHSLDRLTSLFLHALAPLTLHVIRFSSSSIATWSGLCLTLSV